MNTKGPKKKKQHYVPKFYLRGFCGSGDTVFALDKESGGIFTPSVGDFCAERYLYESLSNDPNWYKGKLSIRTTPRTASANWRALLPPS